MGSYMSIRSQYAGKKNKIWAKACSMMLTGKSMHGSIINHHKYKNLAIKYAYKKTSGGNV